LKKEGIFFLKENFRPVLGRGLFLSVFSKIVISKLGKYFQKCAKLVEITIKTQEKAPIFLHKTFKTSLG
jgi:hypothetical protein